MFRDLSSWSGLEQLAASGLPSVADGNPAGDAPPEQRSEAVAESADGRPQQAGDQGLLRQAKGLGTYLFNFATAATKKLTESAAETAQTIKRSIEEGKMDDIIDKTIIDFQKEQKKSVEEQHTKKS